MRALFAMRLSTLSAHGVPTGPLMVAINSLAKVVRQTSPDRMLVAWDVGSSRRRKQLDPRYKGNRPSMNEDDQQRRHSTFDLMQVFCDYANVPNMGIPGEEADDLIAGAWATVLDDNEIVIASGDKDFLQLLGPNPHGVPTTQIRFSSGKGESRAETDFWDADRVLRELGYEPEHVPLVMALWGDETDGVLGVPGIGQKKATKLLAANGWDLDRTIEALKEKGTYPQAVIDRIPVDLQLVDLRTPRLDVWPDEWAPTTAGEARWDNLITFLDHYELAQVKEGRYGLLSGAIWRPEIDEKKLPGRQSWG